MTLPAERLLSPLAISKEHRDQAADLIDDLRAQLKQAASTRRSMSEALSELKARADALAQEVERLRANLETRDKFIVRKDLWGEFVARLDEAALGDRP